MFPFSVTAAPASRQITGLYYCAPSNMSLFSNIVFYYVSIERKTSCNSLAIKL